MIIPVILFMSLDQVMETIQQILATVLMLLSGLDAGGNDTCKSLLSSTKDVSVTISTLNKTMSIGTDTARVEINTNFDREPVEGEYVLALAYLGHTSVTECIKWNEEAEELKTKLEALSNVNSIRVDHLSGQSWSIVRESVTLQKTEVAAGNISNSVEAFKKLIRLAGGEISLYSLVFNNELVRVRIIFLFS